MLCPDYSPNSAGDLSIQLCPDYSPNSAGDLSIQQTCVLTVQVGIKTGGGYEEGGGGPDPPSGSCLRVSGSPTWVGGEGWGAFLLTALALLLQQQHGLPLVVADDECPARQVVQVRGGPQVVGADAARGWLVVLRGRRVQLCCGRVREALHHGRSSVRARQGGLGVGEGGRLGGLGLGFGGWDQVD